MQATFDDKQIRQYLWKVQKNTKNVKKIHKTIALIAMKDINDHFERQEGPEGHWLQRAPATIESYVRMGKGWENRKLLQITGALRNSILPANMITRSAGKSLTLIANIEYSGIHDRGGRAGRGKKVKIPARPFMWLSDTKLEDIANAVLHLISKD